MQRREALQLTATILGGTIFGSEVFLSGRPFAANRRQSFSEDDERLLDEIAETILPESDTSPGAKAAHIGEFMTTIVTDCYDETEAEIFIAGLQAVRDASQARYSQSFIELSSQQRHGLLTEYDRIASNTTDDDDIHFFTMMKQLTIWGYFTSEPGATKALRYNPVPGRYDGCIAYRLGDRAWF
jgi:hypothetical protein